MKTCREKAAEWGISERTVTNLCNNSRIAGAVKVGKSWQIPDDAERPADKRVKSGNTKKIISVTEKKALPIGISDYIRAQSEYYYVDKTLLVKEFLYKKPLVFYKTKKIWKNLKYGYAKSIFRDFFGRYKYLF